MAGRGSRPKNCEPALPVSISTRGRFMLRHAKELEKFELRARDGKIGQVQDFFFDDRQWTVRYLVVDTGTWLDSRKVLISPTAVSRAEWDEQLLVVNLTQDQ